MIWLDKITERFSRRVAKNTSRRHLLKKIGLVLAGWRRSAVTAGSPGGRRRRRQWLSRSGPTDQRQLRR